MAAITGPRLPNVCINRCVLYVIRGREEELFRVQKKRQNAVKCSNSNSPPLNRIFRNEGGEEG